MFNVVDFQSICSSVIAEYFVTRAKDTCIFKSCVRRKFLRYSVLLQWGYFKDFEIVLKDTEKPR